MGLVPPNADPADADAVPDPHHVWAIDVTTVPLFGGFFGAISPQHLLPALAVLLVGHAEQAEGNRNDTKASANSTSRPQPGGETTHFRESRHRNYRFFCPGRSSRVDSEYRPRSAPMRMGGSRSDTRVRSLCYSGSRQLSRPASRRGSALPARVSPCLLLTQTSPPSNIPSMTMIAPQIRRAIYQLHLARHVRGDIARCLQRRPAMQSGRRSRQKGAMPNRVRKDKIAIDPDVLRRIHRESRGQARVIHRRLLEHEGWRVRLFNIDCAISAIGLRCPKSEPKKWSSCGTMAHRHHSWNGVTGRHSNRNLMTVTASMNF